MTFICLEGYSLNRYKKPEHKQVLKEARPLQIIMNSISNKT